MPLTLHRDHPEMHRWQPFAELGQLQERLSQLLDDLPGMNMFSGDSFSLLADLEETEDSFVIEVDLPGIEKKDVSIELSGRRLSVEGERRERERTGVLRRQSRSVGRFHHEIMLPAEVDAEGVSADLDNGVLTIMVPKAQAGRPRHIEIH